MASRSQLERVQRRILIVDDFEQLVQPRDDKHFEYFGLQATQLQFAADAFGFLVENYEFIECGT